MTEGAKTGTPIQRWMLDRSSEGPDEMVKDRRGRYVLLEDHVAALTEALKVAGEALKKAERAIYNLAYKGTERIQDLGGVCDSAEKTGAIAMREAGIEESLAALERIRNQNTSK